MRRRVCRRRSAWSNSCCLCWHSPWSPESRPTLDTELAHGATSRAALQADFAALRAGTSTHLQALLLPPPRTTKQPQACSTRCRVFMAAPSQGKHTCRCLGWSAGGRDEHAHCVRLRLAPRSSRKLDRTVRSSVHGGSVAKANTPAGALVGVPAAETSTHIASASASHFGAAASLLDRTFRFCMHGVSVAKANSLAGASLKYRRQG